MRRASLLGVVVCLLLCCNVCCSPTSSPKLLNFQALSTSMAFISLLSDVAGDKKGAKKTTNGGAETKSGKGTESSTDACWKAIPGLILPRDGLLAQRGCELIRKMSVNSMTQR